MSEMKEFNSFKEFYPFYLGEHSDPVCRGLHLVGTALVLALLGGIIATGNGQLAWLLPVVGYGFAWVGHFFFEHNKPATFKHPFYSLLGDFAMFFQAITFTLPKEHFKPQGKVAK